MRLRPIALGCAGCALTAVLGFLSVPPATAAPTSKAPATKTPASKTPASKTPATKAPATKAPASKTPASKTPVSKTPVSKASATKTPASKTPASKTPASKTPATEAPATGAPATKAPVGQPRISVSAPVTDSRYGARVTITVTLVPSAGDRKVSLYAAPYGGARKLVAAGNVDAQGKWYPTYPVTSQTTFTAVFAGDARTAPASASLTLNVYAQVASRLTGYYQTSSSGSGISYAVFHAAGTLSLYSTVTPGKPGECLEPETEQYDKGVGWHADTKYGCDELDGASHDIAPFSLSQAAGDRYRIRGDYLSSPKDPGNLSEQGPWLYFIVTR